ncbi:MAG: DUF554 domain-containing protein [Clostridia bacterium]|nr:DUF554 domain-containing protein [Clostridia bacterium]
MIGLGTIINVCAIIAGGLLGMLIGKYLKERFQKIINVAMGLSIAAMSLSGLIAGTITVEDGKIGTRGTYMIIFALVFGAIVGEIINIDYQMERFGVWLRKKTGNAKDPVFVDGFLNASFTVCIGAMAVMGSIMDGISGDFSVLLTKAILDFVIILIMAASMGKGCIFSAIPVGIFQGTITLLARLIAPLMGDAAMSNLSTVGSILILCVGINLLADGKYRIKVANLLPAIVFAVVAAYIPFLV